MSLFDPQAIELPLLQKLLHWHGPDEPKPQILVDTHSKLSSQDAFVFVTPEYNYSQLKNENKFFSSSSVFHLKSSLPPALTNFIDHFPYDCWIRKPGTVVTYSMGPFGGIVAGTQLRTVCQVIQLIILPKVTHSQYYVIF